MTEVTAPLAARAC